MNDAAFLVACLYLGGIVLACLALLWLIERFAPGATAGWFGESAELPEADLLRRDTDPFVVDRSTCGTTRGALTCDRYPGHPLPHADSRSGRGDHPVQWITTDTSGLDDIA